MASIHGTNGKDVINAWDGVTHGDDWLYGYGGDDALYALGGGDHLVGGTGADHMDGGAGVDFAVYVSAASGVYVSLKSGRGYSGEAAGDTLVNIEGILGSAHADMLFGDDGANHLWGGLGDDTLNGGDGNDKLHGDASGGNSLVGDDDTLKGGGGDDELFGMVGDDCLNGGAGRDDLYGDFGQLYNGPSGADTFAWWYTEDTGTTAATADVVHDFDFTEGDRIDLHSIDADVYAAGNQDFTFVGTDAFSGTPGELRYYHFGGDTYIEVQTGTSADVEGVIRLAGIHTPTASWFVL
jgi:Ca2+-binding RTX toxin-like protein